MNNPAPPTALPAHRMLGLAKGQILDLRCSSGVQHVDDALVLTVGAGTNDHRVFRAKGFTRISQPFPKRRESLVAGLAILGVVDRHDPLRTDLDYDRCHCCALASADASGKSDIQLLRYDLRAGTRHKEEHEH